MEFYFNGNYTFRLKQPSPGLDQTSSPGLEEQAGRLIDYLRTVGRGKRSHLQLLRIRRLNDRYGQGIGNR